MRCHCILVRIADTTKTRHVGKNLEQREPFLTSGKSIISKTIVEKSMEGPQKAKT